MSWITNLVLSFGIMEDAPARIAEVNAFFERVPHDYQGGVYQEEPLASVEPVWQGKGTALECNLYIGAYSYFPIEEFLSHLRSVGWEEPESVQLLVQDQDDTRFHLIEILGPGPLPSR